MNSIYIYINKTLEEKKRYEVNVFPVIIILNVTLKDVDFNIVYCCL